MSMDFSEVNLPEIGKQSKPTALEPLVLYFAVPTDYLTMNQRKHWSWTAQRKRIWRETTHYAALQWRSSPSERHLEGRHLISFGFPMATKRRRDPHNYYPTIKPVVDGLIDAGLWPDDTPEFVATTEPTFIESGKPVIILIRKI